MAGLLSIAEAIAGIAKSASLSAEVVADAAKSIQTSASTAASAVSTSGMTDASPDRDRSRDMGGPPITTTGLASALSSTRGRT